MVVLCAATTYHDMSGSRSLRLSKSAEESNLLLDALSASGSNIDMVPQIRRTERLLSRVLQNSTTTKLLNSFPNPYFRQGFDGYTLPFPDPLTILFTSLVPRLSHASLFSSARMTIPGARVSGIIPSTSCHISLLNAH